MIVKIKTLTLTLFLLTASLPLSAQIPSAFPDDTATTSSITIEVIDIITHQHVSGCTVTIADTSGPLQVLSIDSVIHTVIPRGRMTYTATITKPGYDTLVAEWFPGLWMNEFYIDFYMRKVNMTREEKKEAARQSKNVPVHRPEIFNQGGFQHVGPGKREILEWKIEEYGIHGVSGSVHSFRKMKSL